MADNIKVVVKIFEIIELLNQYKSLSLKDIAGKTSMPKPTVFRILSTLQKLNYVSFASDTRLYSLGYKFVAIAKDAVDDMDVVSISKPHMVKLKEAFGETVNLAKLIGKEVIYLSILESSHQFRYVDIIGDTAPLHSTAIGKAIIAFLGDKELAAIFENYTFTRFTKNTIQNFQDLKDHLLKIRESGVAVDNEEGHEEVICVGVPLFDRTNRPAAAISIATPKIRANKKLVENVKEELLRVGVRISLEMGVRDIRKCYTI